MVGKVIEVKREGLSHAEIGKLLGISRSAVFFIERDALAKIAKAKKQRQLLKPFLT